MAFLDPLALIAEVHLLLCPGNLPGDYQSALKRLGARYVESSQVAYFDTAGLSYFGQGAIFRVETADGKAKLTVKIKSDLGVSSLEKKCELDYTIGREFYACAHREQVDKQDVNSVWTHQTHLQKLLDSDQQKLLAKQGFRFDPVAYGFGPVRKTVWAAPVEGMSIPAQLEFWRMDQRLMLLEASVRVSAKDRQRALFALGNWAAKNGVAVCREQESKSLLVLRQGHAPLR